MHSDTNVLTVLLFEPLVETFHKDVTYNSQVQKFIGVKLGD